MAGTLIRVTDFAPATPILSAEVDAELNQLVNLLNGTTSNVKAVIKVSDAGDPPLELNQLSTGPIQKWFQGGILKASIANDGSLATAGNITINNANPTLIFDDTAGTDAKIDLDASILRFGSIAANQVTLDVSTGVATFSQIPVGPASDPTTDNQLPRKKYVDDKTTWTKTWFYPVLPGAVESAESVGRLIIIGGSRTITSITAVWAGGSDSGASNVFTIKRRNSSGTLQSDVGTVDVNTPAQDALQVSAVSVALADGDQIYPLLTTRNTASETLVSISVRGI